MSLGYQLQHTATCRGGRCLTRHSQDIRGRLSGSTIWRLQGTTSHAVFTVRPHLDSRCRQKRPEATCNAALATPSEWRVARCAVIFHPAPLALDRLPGAVGPQ